MNREISFYQYLTPEEQDLLDRSMQQVTCRKSQVVHRHGDSCVGLIFVRKGRLAFSILSEEGREITVFRIEKGESCILSAACVLQSLEFESHITAEVNSEIAILPAPTLSQLMNSNPFANGSVIFTQNGYYAREFARRTDGGQVGINVGIPVPMGIFSFTGHKKSFFGDLHCHGKDAIKFFTETKTVTQHWFDEEEMRHEEVSTWDGTI